MTSFSHMNLIMLNFVVEHRHSSKSTPLIKRVLKLVPVYCSIKDRLHPGVYVFKIENCFPKNNKNLVNYLILKSTRKCGSVNKLKILIVVEYTNLKPI